MNANALISSLDKIESLHEKMRNCFQFANISMIDHGQMVSDAYKKLKKALNEAMEDNTDYLEQIGFNQDKAWLDILLKHQYDEQLMHHYHFYHDCGKPFCREIDENNRQHFPDHANISMQIYDEHFQCKEASKMIEADMNFHSMNAQQMQQWLDCNQNEKHFLASLYLSAWAEILANSTMFGGMDSEGFKIKRKKLMAHGKKLYACLSKNQS